jgi:hypothetical protein
MQGAALWTKIEYASIMLLGDGFLTASAGSKFFAGSLELMKVAMLTSPAGIFAVAIGAIATAFLLFDKDAKAASTSLDNFNNSLMKTDFYLDKVQEKLSKGIYTDNSAAIDKMNMVDLNKYRDDALAREKEIGDKINENDTAMTMLMGKGRGQANLGRVRELEDANKLLSFNLSQIKSGREKADKRIKNMPKTGITNQLAGDIAMKQTNKVTGNRSINIKIDINNLINEFSVKTTTINESTKKITELVTQALLAAVNDSQNVAGL